MALLSSGTGSGAPDPGLSYTITTVIYAFTWTDTSVQYSLNVSVQVPPSVTGYAHFDALVPAIATAMAALSPGITVGSPVSKTYIPTTFTGTSVAT
jgi:hypothetical protein